MDYPLSFPVPGALVSARWRLVRAQAVSRAPTSFQTQVFDYLGDAWEVEVEMVEQLGEPHASAVRAFLLSLDGMVGTFLLGDPSRPSLRGAGGGTPVLDGTHVHRDRTVSIRGLPPSVTGWALADDWIQLGSGVTARLHKVMADVDSSAAGTAIDIEIRPGLRHGYEDGSPVTVTGARGLFRLSDPTTEWTLRRGPFASIGFSAIESL